MTPPITPPVTPAITPPVTPPITPPVIPSIIPPITVPSNPSTPITTITTNPDPFVYKDTDQVITNNSTSTVITNNTNNTNNVNNTDTTNNTNNSEPPIIYAEDLTIPLKSKFSLKDGVTAYENNGEGEDISNKVTVSGKINTSKVGNYKLTYKVTDVNGQSTTKVITVTVSDKATYIHPTNPNSTTVSNSNAPVINAKNITIPVGGKFNFKDGVTSFASNGKGENITNKITVKGSVNTSKPGQYPITYSVTDRENRKTTKTIIVTVVDPKK